MQCVNNEEFWEELVRINNPDKRLAQVKAAFTLENVYVVILVDLYKMYRTNIFIDYSGSKLQRNSYIPVADDYVNVTLRGSFLELCED